MKNIWILVADSSRARIFETESVKSPLKETDDLTHPEARQHEQTLTSDLPGKQAASSSGSHHAVADETDPKQHEAANFAREISQYLDDSRKKNRFSHLVILAAPSFLGLLRDHFTEDTLKLISYELDKNLVKHSTDEIRQHLPDRLH